MYFLLMLDSALNQGYHNFHHKIYWAHVVAILGSCWGYLGASWGHQSWAQGGPQDGGPKSDIEEGSVEL